MSNSAKLTAVGLLVFAVLTLTAWAQIGGTGWKTATVSFDVQDPYNVPVTNRYFFTNNIYHCLTYSNDASFEEGSTTLPRTEMRFNPDFTSGEMQYQAVMMVPAGENSYCIMQDHTGDAQSPTYGPVAIMFIWQSRDGGSIWNAYTGQELAKNMGGQWFQLNVDHNIATHTIRAWINGQLVVTEADNGATDYYFKTGVYEQNISTPTLEMDTYVTNSIKMWTSSGTNPPAAPTGLTATPGFAQIGLTWNSSVGATNYNVKRSTISGGAYTNIASLTGTNYTDTGMAIGTTYYYVVSAADQFGMSSNSTPAAGTAAILSATAYWTNLVTTAPQNWNMSGNWTNVTTFPNTTNELVIINANIAAPQTINLNQSIIISALQIGDASGSASYTIAANDGSLTFGGTNTVLLTQLSTSKGDILATPISITTNLLINNDSTNPLTLAGALSSSGGALTLGSGTLQIGNGATNGSLGSVNVTDSGALIFNCDGNVTNSGVISGTGALTNNGSGTVTLSAAETYTGLTVVNGGTLALAAGNNGDSTLYKSSGIIIINGGAVQIDTDNSLTGNGDNAVPVTINAGGTLTGLGTADGGTGTSTHIWGVLNLDGGTLTDGGTQLIPGWGTWDLNGGVAVNGGTNTSTINCLDVVPCQTGGTSFNITAGKTPSGIDLLVSGTLIHGTSAGDTGIIKTGAGFMALSGANTYTGSTTVSGGTLALSGSGSINSSASITVSNATLNVSGLTGTFKYPNSISLTNGTLNLGTVQATNSSLSLGNSTVNLYAPGTNIVAGTLTTGGKTNTINLSSLPPYPIYPTNLTLIKYGTLSGAFNLTVGPLPVGYTGFLSNNPANSSVVLTLNSAITPRISALSFLGTNLVFSGSNGFPNGIYVVLASTNLVSPITNWTAIATNTFDASGNFSCTNFLNSGMPQTFYLLKLE